MNTPPVYTTTEIRKIESLVLTAPNPPCLMEKAGLAAAEIAKARFLTHDRNRVLVLAGPGNNGGDAFVLARHLRAWEMRVTLVFTGETERLSQDAKQALNRWQLAGGSINSDIPATEQWDCVIDGLFGIGLDKKRTLSEKYQKLILHVNSLNIPILALDIPSGLHSDSGNAQDVTIRADITATFIALKPGLLTHDGCDFCGKIILCDLGIDTAAMIPPQTWLLNKSSIGSRLPRPRPANSHKGSYGSVGILGGTSGMIGAALLAGRAALKLGAGRVYLGLLAAENTPAFDPNQPELMLRSPRDFFVPDFLDCLVVGPGLGTQITACAYLEQALHTDLPLIIDADALNLIASYSELSHILQKREASAVLTPHPAEAARLLDLSTAEVQRDRLNTARYLAEQFNCPIVLKGAGSICALPNGHCYFNTTGNPGLSTAGTGDVLSGFLGALLTQGLSPEDALLSAVYLHGAAADALLDRLYGPVGMTASEIILSARKLLNCWVYRSNFKTRYDCFSHDLVESSHQPSAKSEMQRTHT